MSLQGSIVVVADQPAGDLLEALETAGAFPIVETTWTDAPTAFVSVKPSAVVIAEPGSPPSEASARMLCLQIATATGPTVPVIARMANEGDLPVPIALASEIQNDRVIARLRAALRVRALHATMLGRIESSGAESGKLPELPIGDPLDDATVMIVGRGPLYPALTVAIGERFGVVGALSVESAAKHLNSRDIDGIVIGDGFDPIMVDAFLTAVSEDDRFRNIPVAVIGDASDELATQLPNLDRFGGSPAGIVSRMIPMVRLHAFEARLKRMLAALDSNGVTDPDTGLLMRDHFWHEMNKAVRDSQQNSTALSVGRFTFDGDFSERSNIGAARMVTRLTRDSDFAYAEDDGGILIVFGQTDLNSAHVIARRIAAVLRNTMLEDRAGGINAHVTLATLKATDTIDSLMRRVNGGEVVAAE